MFFTFVMTCDSHQHAMQGFAHQWNKYASPEWPVVVVGFTIPDFPLPSNFQFISLGKQEDYPVSRWSDALMKLLRDWMYPGEIFCLMLEDYWLTRPVNQEAILSLHEYMHFKPEVLKMDLCEERLHAAGSTHYDDYGDIPIIKSDYNSQYHMSLWTGLWRRELLMKYLEPNEDPWQIETIGTLRVAEDADDVLVLGSTISPLEHTLIFRNATGMQMLTDGLSEADRLELTELGFIHA